MFSLAPEFQILWYEWAMVLFAALLIGFSKAGIKGIAVVSVTLLALVYGAKASTGILMPMLIAADIYAIIYYRNDVIWKHIYRLMPWMVAGVLLGTWIGKDLPEDIFRQGMAIIILLTVGMMYWWDRQKEVKVPEGLWFSSIMGLAAGFTTMIGNLAGPFSNLYFLAMRLPKNEFIGTAAWLFFFINLFKLPFHIFVWETISLESFKVNLFIYPALFFGLIIGVKLIRMIKDDLFRKMVILLTAIGAIAIFFK
ncbi:MAG: sulfite exporter TauE/SafE family protein [Bacteroidia bacterium]|nr:sulfite exporter TauE/SafE family protein [Bacteroidia bacterium]